MPPTDKTGDEKNHTSSFEFCGVGDVLQTRGLPINQEGRKSELSPRGLGTEKREPLGRKVEQTGLGLEAEHPIHAQPDPQMGA